MFKQFSKDYLKNTLELKIALDVTIYTRIH